MFYIIKHRDSRDCVVVFSPGYYDLTMNYPNDTHAYLCNNLNTEPTVAEFNDKVSAMYWRDMLNKGYAQLTREFI